MYQEQFSWPSIQTYCRFLINRISRIYPAHVFVLGLFLTWESLTYMLVQFYGFSALPFDGCLSPATFATNMLMVHDWGGWFGNCSWNYPAWSISSEWLAYLLFPITLLVLKFSKKAVPALLASIALYILFLTFALDDDLSLQSVSGTIRVLMEFSLGVLVFRIHLRLIHLISSQVCNFMCLGAMVGAVLGLHFGFSDGLILPFLGGIVLFTAIMKDGVMHRMLNARWLVFLGEASYSIYLIHAFDQRVWNSIAVRIFGETFSIGMTYFYFFTVMAGIIASGVLVYILVEKPSRRWIQKQWIKSYE